MNSQLKTFLASFLLSMPFWWGVNVCQKDLESFFYWHQLSQNPQIFTASMNLQKKLENMKPIKKEASENLKIEAESAISVFVEKGGEKEKTLFKKNINKKLPIASLSKLMTTKVVLEHYNLSEEIKVSKETVSQKENAGHLSPGQKLTVKTLLYPLLMESSNDAAFSLAADYKKMTKEKFVRLMNREAKEMGLSDTFFVNTSGVEPKNSRKLNHSTAKELAELTKKLLKEPLLWEILSTPKIELYGKKLVNNNELLGKLPTIIGGKTGYTEKAGECMILVTTAAKNQGHLINVILGSENRFGETEKLTNWVIQNYKW